MMWKPPLTGASFIYIKPFHNVFQTSDVIQYLTTKNTVFLFTLKFEIFWFELFFLIFKFHSFSFYVWWNVRKSSYRLIWIRSILSEILVNDTNTFSVLNISNLNEDVIFKIIFLCVILYSPVTVIIYPPKSDLWVTKLFSLEPKLIK